ncbi:MAG: 2-hydroxy-acid oxidase [Jatrophihabitantaceae bacterium]
MPAPGRPAPGLPKAGLRLVRAERRTFAGPAEFLADPGNRAAVSTYLSDLIRAYPPELSELSTLTRTPAAAPLRVSPSQGQSYGEMAEFLIGTVVPADQPVDLLVLAFSIHDLQPGRATATYLSHRCPGNPLSFAICDQGSAAAYSALRIARDYPTSTERSRSLVIIVEQAALPYGDGAALPAQHRGVALLLENGPMGTESAGTGSAGTGSAGTGSAGPGSGRTEPDPARLVALTQRPDLAAAAVAGQAAADLAELSAGYPEVRLVLSRALATTWPGHPSDGVRIGPADQPTTGIWWQLLDELDAQSELNALSERAALDEPDAGRPSLLVAADYDPDLRYLCMAAIEPA